MTCVVAGVVEARQSETRLKVLSAEALAKAVGALAGIEQLRKILMYGFYSQSRFGLLTNPLVELPLSGYSYVALGDAVAYKDALPDGRTSSGGPPKSGDSPDWLAMCALVDRLTPLILRRIFLNALLRGVAQFLRWK
jgi:hypothetical protein